MADPGAPPAYGGAAAPWNAPAVSPALAMQAMSMPPARKPSNRGFLRFFAVACVSTAWLTLILSVLLGILTWGFGATLKTWSSMAGGFSSSPGISSRMGGDSDGLGSGGLGGGGGLSGGGASGAQQQMLNGLMGGFADRLAAMCTVGAFLHVLMGICGYIFFVGLGKLTYGFLDLEEQADRDHAAVQIMLARDGSV
jgi:hypothetical protein